ncbi:MAG: nuclear transport factor 2 family protein [Chitinophagaceae bacterium]|nr:nuclear transport factor 2 family protein [Chitinophagaceae bacterium]
MRLLFLAAVILLASCSQHKHDHDGSAKFDIEPVRAHIDNANKTYGERFTSNDTAFYAARYCMDAVIMPEQMGAIHGRDSIRHFNYNGGNNKDFKISITATSVYGSADAVIEEGVYTFPGDDGVIYDKGKFIAIWKQEDGKWKLFREIWNTDNAPPKN